MTSFNVIFATWILLTTFSLVMTKRNSYMVNLLKTVRPGQSTKIWVTVFKGKPAIIDITLRDSDWEALSSVSTTITRRKPQSLELKIPSTLNQTSYTIEAIGSGCVSFQHNQTVKVSTKTSSIFIQTDKRVYKPGQKVLIRCLGIYPDLKLVTGSPFGVYIYDSKDNLVKHWDDVKPELSCVFQGQLQLTEYTNLGQWKIECKQQSESAVKYFDVEEVVFPRFEVTLSLPTNPSIEDEELVIPVSVRYTFGKAVKGSLVMTYRNAVNTITTKHFQIDGDLITTVPMSDITKTFLLDIEITATVTEKLTGLKQSTTKEITIHRFLETLEFPAFLPKVFKPGLPFFGILRLSGRDRRPLPGATGKHITITGTYVVLRDMEEDEFLWRKLVFKRFSQSDHTTTKALKEIKKVVPPSGIIDFNVTLPLFAISARIQACYKKACAYHSMQKAQSPSGSYIQLRLLSDASMLEVGKKLKFTIKSNRKVRFVIYKIVSGRIGTIIRIRRCRLKQNKEYQLVVRVTRLMAPRFTILVYYTEGAEVVADSLTLNVKGMMKKPKVNIKFSKSRVQPAEAVILSTKAPKCADVHILAVDKRTLLMKKGNDITQKDVEAELQTYDLPRPVRWATALNGIDAFTTFEDANMAVLTDLTIYDYRDSIKRSSPSGVHFTTTTSSTSTRTTTFTTTFPSTTPSLMPTRTVQEEVTVTGKAKLRKNIPETWLFQTLKAGQKLTLKAPDAITTYIASAFAVCCEDKKGFGIAANTASLTVFQKYFVRVTLPYAAIRKEILVVQVDLFNYENMDSKFYVMIRKALSGEYAFIKRNGKEFIPSHSIFKQFWVKEVYVAADGVGTVYFPIKPLQVGDVRIRVDASIITENSIKKIDSIQRLLLVKAEGVPQSYNTALLKSPKNGETDSELVNITFPPNIVDGSQHLKVTVVGDILGSALAGIEDLLQMSYGCGEQNLIGFVPNVFITSYLKHTGRLTTKLEERAKRFIAAGYQRELRYMRYDGSFSAFGNSDSHGSTWLTALVVKSFAEAKDLVYIQPKIFRDAISWLVERQLSSGAFEEPGNVVHQLMQGGSASSVRSLAAFVVIALIEARKQDCVPENMTEDVNYAIDLTLGLISNDVPNSLENMYEMAIVLYALSLAGHSARDVVFTALDALATEKDGHKYWTLPSDKLNQVAGWSSSWSPSKTQASGIDIEMTSYVLSSLVIMDDLSNGWRIVKWITSQQNSRGGFVSTQDTMVALQALTAMASLIFSDSTSIKVTVSDPNGQFTHAFTIDSSNLLYTQIAEVDHNVQKLLVEATGTGICIIEVSVHFNIERELRIPSYWINATVTQKTRGGYRLSICFRWLRSGSSRMSLLQFEVPTGMDADDGTLETGKAASFKRRERKGSAVILYFDSISSDIMCISIYVAKVDMVVNPHPRPCSIIDYYEPSRRMTIQYLPEGMGSSSLEDVCGNKCA